MNMSSITPFQKDEYVASQERAIKEFNKNNPPNNSWMPEAILEIEKRCEENIDISVNEIKEILNRHRKGK